VQHNASTLTTSAHTITRGVNLIATPIPFDGTEPPLHIPEFASLGMDSLPLSDWARHCLATGESGSGKTLSFILPLATALLRHPGAPSSTTGEPLPISMLVFDPKREIGRELLRANQALATPRQILAVGQGSRRPVRIDLFEGDRTATLTAELVVSRILTLSSTYTAGVQHGRDPFWWAAVENALHTLIAVDLHIASADGAKGVGTFWAQVAADITISQLRSGRSATTGLAYTPGEYLRPHLTLLRLASVTLKNDRTTSIGNDTTVHVLASYAKICRLRHVPDELVLAVESIAAAAHDTFASIIATLDPLIAPVIAPAFTAAVSLNPLERPTGCTRLLLAMDRGSVVVVLPSGFPSSSTSRAVMRAVKSSWYRLLFQRQCLERPVAIIADEAHQVITNDDEQSAESSVLDRCRAFRTIVVLATQSVAALREAMHSGRADTDSALQALLTNTATKMVFRSTDPATRGLLRTLFPERFRANRPHVIDVRPPVSLKPEEAYVVAASGETGRGRVVLGSRPDVHDAERTVA